MLYMLMMVVPAVKLGLRLKNKKRKMDNHHGGAGTVAEGTDTASAVVKVLTIKYDKENLGGSQKGEKCPHFLPITNRMTNASEKEALVSALSASLANLLASE